MVQTRLTVGRVKPLLDLHRLSAREAIMIPYNMYLLIVLFDNSLVFIAIILAETVLSPPLSSRSHS